MELTPACSEERQVLLYKPERRYDVGRAYIRNLEEGRTLVARAKREDGLPRPRSDMHMRRRVLAPGQEDEDPERAGPQHDRHDE